MMLNYKQISFGLVGMLLSHVATFAQTKSMSLPQCVQMAVEKNLQMQFVNKQIERAKALQGTAWDIDKTDFSLSQDPSSGGSPDNAISISQTIDFPTLYAARHGQLKAETQAEKSRGNVVRKTLENEVKRTYFLLVYEMERLRVLGVRDSVLVRYRNIAQKRFDAGETRRLEVLSAERLLRENKMEMALAQSEIENVQLQLTQMVGSEVPVQPAETKLEALDYVQKAFNYSQTPEGQYAQDRVAVTDKAVKVAKNGYAPSLSLSLRNQLVITSWDPYHQNRSKFDGGNFMGFEVGIGVPLFFGATKARVKAAKKEVEAAKLEMRQEQQVRQQEYLAGLSRCNAAFSRLSYYQGEGKKNAQDLERLSSLEYENGEISYVEYVTALQESLDAKMKLISAINDFNQSVIALERITGE